MAQIEVNVKQKIEVKTIYVEAGVRYWEDATVDGVEDEKGDLIPCRDGDTWKPTIEIETGKILNWKQGVKADIHYKVCDDGTYSLMDSEFKRVATIDGYVPKFMSPKENGYGDYIIMEVDENGIIQNWNPDLSVFEDSGEG